MIETLPEPLFIFLTGVTVITVVATTLGTLTEAVYRLGYGIRPESGQWNRKVAAVNALLVVLVLAVVYAIGGATLETMGAIQGGECAVSV